MDRYSNEEIRTLVREDRIHRKVFLDPEIFSLEMDRVFGRGWVYVGHDSLVPKPGDFFATKIGLQPVVLVRHSDGRVRVLYNRCGHRGAKVVNEEVGNVRRFTCLYHGWAYDTDGRLTGVPLRDEYSATCDLNDPRRGMMPVAQVERYRGFVFANLSAGGSDLRSYLGEARHGIDDLVDAAPDGAVELAGGCHRYEYNGNWKHQWENLADTYHTVALHASTLKPDGQQFHRRPGTKGGQAAFLDKTGSPVILNLFVETYPNGHNSTESLIAEEQAGGEVEAYRALLEKRLGPERTREILKPRLHNLAIYPNLDILISQSAIRVVMPIAVDRTEVRIYPVKLKGAPPEMFESHVKYLSRTHSASSLVQTDDMEAFERVQAGLAAQTSDWCLVARGIQRDRISKNGIGFGDRSSEIGQRHQHKAWLNRMCAP
jgi:benzoate/toluate 1,2-dioxygenase subunit alpha